MASSLRVLLLLGVGLLFALPNDAFAKVSRLKTTAHVSGNHEALPFAAQRLRSLSSDHLLVAFSRPSRYVRGLRQTSRDAGNRDGDAVCASLTAQEEDCLNTTTRSWLVDEDILVEAGNNLQAIINCVNDGDVLLLNVSERILVNSPIEIGNNLTISAVTESTCLVNGVYPKAEREATFTCPDAENGVFIVRSKDALFANLRFENCSLNKSRGAKAIIDVSKCRSDEGAKDGGDIRLHHVTFEGNVLNDTASLRMRPPACSALELIDIELKNNTCNGRCGIILSKEYNRLRDVKVELAHQTAEDSHSTVFDAPDGSTIDATNVTAISNEVEIFHIDKGTLILQKSKLSNNALSFMAADHSFSVCMHLVNATADITDCQFEENEGAEGAIVFAKQSSNVTMRNCTIKGTKATEGGGGAVVLQDKTTGTFEDCNFTRGHTEERGGFIAARDWSDMTIRRSQFKEATAKDGGCVYVSLSSAILLEDVTFEKCHSVTDGGALRLTNVSSASISNVNMISNSAGSDGGCMYAEFSTVTGTGWTVTDNTAGNHAGAFRIRLSSNASIADSKFSNNRADRGGAVSLELDSTARFEDVKFRSSAAATDGGVFSITESEMTLFHCQLQDGSAENGGFLYSRKNASVAILHSRLIGGEARNGGCLCSLDGSLTVQNSTFRKCHSDEYGGAMHLANITVEISDSRFLKNEAGDDGGAIYIEKTHAKRRNTLVGNNEAIENKTHTKHTKSFRVNSTLFKKNVAANGGAMHLSSFDDETLDHQMLDNITSVGNRCFEFGGAVSIVNSTLHIARSSFRDGNAELGGAFVSARRNSSLVLEDCEMNNGSSHASGGAIAVYESKLKGKKLTISNSTALDGGALFFEFSDITQQKGELKNCTIRNNTADHGGGLYVRSKDPSIQCSDTESNCTFITLSDTVFSQNTAKIAGGAAFADSSKMIQDDCGEDPTAEMTVNVTDGETDGEDLSETDCKVWQMNKAEKYGPNIASFAHRATASINVSTNDAEGNERIKNYESGNPMTIYLKVEDDRGQRPAIGKNDRYVMATVSSEDQLFKGSPEFLVSEDVAEINITGFAKPGNYTLRIDFEEEGLESHKFEVQVKECAMGHVRHENGDLCVSCSSSTFSFLPETDKTCHPCPENGNCATQVIHPNNNYWHASPCSKKITRCLSSHVCHNRERAKKLERITRAISNCNISNKSIEEYQQAQCEEGHTGPRCGSCIRSYASSLSCKCKKCSVEIGNVLVICISVAILLILSGITIRGTLSTTNRQRMMISGQRRILRDVQLVGLSVRSTAEKSKIESPPDRSHDIQGTNATTTEMLHVTEATLAQWKAVEMFKITLNYIQVSVLLASLDVGWASPVLILGEIAEFFGGLAAESIRRSVVCLSRANQFLHPTVWGTMVSISIVPVSAFLLLVAFWVAVALLHRVQQPLRYIAQRLVLSVMALWYITSVPVIKATLSAVLCVRAYNVLDGIPNDDGTIDTTREEEMSYWAVDTSLKCFEGDHLILAIWILLSVSIVYGGLLIVFISILASAKGLLDHPDSWVYRTTGFLYRGYGSGWRRYWEVTTVLRKAIVAFLVFCAHRFDSLIFVTCAAIFIIVAIGAQIVVMPYREKFCDLNRIDLFALFVLCFTILIANMLESEGVTKEWRRLALSIICVVLNTFAFLVLLSFLFSYCVQCIRLSTSECGTYIDADAGTRKILTIWLNCQIQSLAQFMGFGRFHDQSSLSSDV